MAPDAERSTVVVTGAAGFVGARLVERLGCRGDLDVVGVARSATLPQPGVTWTRADLSRDGWTDALPDAAHVAVHLAQSRRYREFPDGADDMRRVNVDATAELLEWARRAGVRHVVVASTGSVYAPSDAPLAEDAPCEARSMYAATKLAAEHIARQYASLFRVTVLRPFGVYGPGQPPNFVRAVLDRLRSDVPIEVASGVGLRITPVHVDDCVAAIASLLDADDAADARGTVLNVAGTEIATIREIAELAAAADGRRARFVESPAPPTSLVADTTRLRARGWAPTVSLRDGLAALVRAEAGV